MIIRLVKVVISSLVYIVDELKKGIFRIIGQKLPPRSVVLYYHIVNKDQRRRFGQQMDDLLRFAIPLRANNKGGLEGGKNYVSITIDDGFICIIENAIPELVKRQIPFTIFVPTGYIGGYSDWAKKDLCQTIGQRVIDEIQLRDLENSDLATIGSHCVMHLNLLLLPSDKARAEIFKSKSDLENILKHKVDLLSFPHGAYTPQHIEWAHAAGYCRVFTIEPTLAFKEIMEFKTGRFNADPSDWRIEFRLKLQGAYRWLPFASSLKRKTLDSLRSLKMQRDQSYKI